MEKRADIVGWKIGIHDNVRFDLVNYLEEASKSKAPKKKRKRVPVDVPADVTPYDTSAGSENTPPRQPLVSVQQLRPSATMQSTNKPSSSTTIFYMLDGRAGLIVIPDNGLLLVSKMRKNLAPLPYTDTAKAKKRRDDTRLYLATFGAVSAWIPAQSSLITKPHLSHMRGDSSRIYQYY